MSDKISAMLDKVIAAANNPKNLNEAGEFVQAQAKLLAPADTGYLRNSIFLDVEKTTEGAEAKIYTNLQYAPFVEFGTGPKGAANHEGVSPEVTVAYTMEPWWIHESMVEPGVAEKYHWYHIDTEQGRFYKIEGQAAQPFMYPAIHDNVKTVVDIIHIGIKEALK